jgi:hypothetical protein
MWCGGREQRGPSPERGVAGARAPLTCRRAGSGGSQLESARRGRWFSPMGHAWVPPIRRRSPCCVSAPFRTSNCERVPLGLSQKLKRTPCTATRVPSPSSTDLFPGGGSWSDEATWPDAITPDRRIFTGFPPFWSMRHSIRSVCAVGGCPSMLLNALCSFGGRSLAHCGPRITRSSRTSTCSAYGH